MPNTPQHFTPLRVAILLCTYNGQSHLAEQLDSYASQTHPNWAVWASDDGSQDSTLEILESYRTNWGNDKITICTGPRKGFSANFMSLVCDADISAEYFAFSDQDDIWMDDKLERALQWLDSIQPGIPALYCSRTLIINEHNQEIGFSPRLHRPPSFRNALVQSIAGGNTMVFNRSARELLLSAKPDLPVVSHDWWTYMVVSGCGGQVFYDPSPSIRYRRHKYNIIGKKHGARTQLTRILTNLNGRFKDWLDINMAALSHLQDKLTDENKKTFLAFCHARRLPFFAGTIALMASGVHRQTSFGNIVLLLSSSINRV